MAERVMVIDTLVGSEKRLVVKPLGSSAGV